VYLGDGSPDGRSCLLVAFAEAVMRLLAKLLGAEEVFRSGHGSSSCARVPSPPFTPACVVAGELITSVRLDRARLRSKWPKAWKRASACKLHRWW
jgi:hypothetical protein